MKKIIIALTLVLSALFNINTTYAYNDIINEINIEVNIDDNGDAYFKEVWVTEVGSGTENYKVYNNMGSSKITDFKVSDEKNKNYTYLKNWDINKSRQEKTNKCGIIERNGNYELCWGVGEYGYRTYTLTYTITNFVEQYIDNQGINFVFIDSMDLYVEKAKIDIYSSTKFNLDNSDIYAFGYYGKVNYKNGHVILETDQGLGSYSKMQLLMRIDDKTFKGGNKQNITFDEVLRDAKVESDYNSWDDYYDNSYNDNYYNDYYDPFFTFDPTFIFAIIGWILSAVLSISSTSQQRKSMGLASVTFEDGTVLTKNELKDVNMFRDIPCQKDLYYFYYLAYKSELINDEQRAGLIAAILLKWIKEKKIEFKKTQEKGLFNTKEGYEIDLSGTIETSCSVETELLDMLRRASRENQILETNEFENWCRTNYAQVDAWFDRVESYVENEMTTKGLLDKTYKVKKGLLAETKVFTKTYKLAVKEEIKCVYGLKKFLKEMSRMHEKEVIEVKMWEEYLMFATVLGIADEVEEQLKIKCPEFTQVSNIDVMYTTRMTRSFTYSSIRAARLAQYSAQSRNRSFGGGGRSSFGGGGGHFRGGGGGGHGGGRR